MKKLLIILLSIIFGFNSVFANTDVENFVFNKLFDEYSKCTVYYKFLSRGVEKKGELVDKASNGAIHLLTPFIICVTLLKSGILI